MAISFPLAAAVGLILGFLAGLGIGGGSLLMLWLTLAADLPLPEARCVNLLFFIPCALISSIFRLKQGDLPIKKLLLPIALGCAVAAGCSFISDHLETEGLKKVFGVLLLLTGMKELCFRRK